MLNDKTLHIFILITVFAWNIGCAQNAKFHKMNAIETKDPIQLILKPKIGWKDKSIYSSRTITKTYTNGEITRKIQEDLDFEVATEVLEHNPINGNSKIKVSTLSKDGKADLADYAMPELGESLEFTFNPQSMVLRAGDYPPGTIYFVPPLSLPDKAVNVGDTWPMVADWLNLKSGMPLRMSLVSTLKSLKSCGTQKCAEIDLSGSVSIVGAENNPISSKNLKAEDLKLRFQSQFSGRILYAIDSSTVLYSLLTSEEKLTGTTESVDIRSCIQAILTEPTKDQIVESTRAKCNPNVSN